MTARYFLIENYPNSRVQHLSLGIGPMQYVGGG